MKTKTVKSKFYAFNNKIGVTNASFIIHFFLFLFFILLLSLTACKKDNRIFTPVGSLANSLSDKETGRPIADIHSARGFQQAMNY